MNSVMSHPSERQVAVSATKLLINNRWIANESGKTFTTIDPVTGAEICQVSEGGQSGPGSVRTRPWCKTQASERGRLLHRLTDLIH